MNHPLTPGDEATLAASLRPLIRDVPDFPRPGILFRDITPLLAEPPAFQAAVGWLAGRLAATGTQAILAIESRGFIFGAAVADRLGLPLHLVRKPGKLPRRAHRISYTLEYGEDTLELHEDVIVPGRRYAIVDDLVATGGTAAAVAQLVRQQGGTLVECVFLVELLPLGGRRMLGEVPVSSLITYP
jgi:adenine phosphoribosyltransferase